MAHVLIVDDNKINRQLLQEIILNAHPEYTISAVTDGKTCLEFVRDNQPDIILLDVMMPEVNGYEVCSSLKADDALKVIPVILITALDKIEEKVQGFQVGAADYIVKPINSEETLARIDAHLQIKQSQDELKKINEELRKTQEALIQSAKMSAVGSLAAGVAHEFNNILSMLGGYIQLCKQKDDLDYIHNIMNIFEELVTRGQDIVQSLHDFSRKTEFHEKRLVDIVGIIKKDLILMKNHFHKQGVAVETSFASVPQILCYPGQLSQVFVNLMKNASEAMHEEDVRTLTISVKTCRGDDQECRLRKLTKCPHGQCILICFKDTGPGMPAEIANKIFEPFVTTKGVLGGGDISTPGTGLGLSISYGIVKRHDGDIFLEDTGSKGTSISINLPVHQSV